MTKNSNEMMLGIRQIWVSKTCRKQNIASRLVDCARMKFLIGNIIEKKNVLFSQPTVDGLAFAKSYVKLDYILTYI